ncbi:hypothetical protein C0995_015496 [Termitomyces sp. Mi166|nr:hypothetical protein C0995_015496 [Termitomyces sp. Mi166\
MRAPDPSHPFNLEQVAQYALIFGRPGLENTWQGITFDFAFLHVPNDQARNFSDDDALHVLLHNRIPLDWVDHAYTYGVVYLEQQFHSPTMSLNIFREVDNERIERLSRYGTPSTILHWDGWREMMEDNHYCLMFKHDEERLMPDSPEAKGLYYYIGMDPNQVHLWKHTAAHSKLPLVPTATNIALMELSMVDAKVVSGPLTLPRTELVPHESATNITIDNVAMTMESEAVPDGNAES